MNVCVRRMQNIVYKFVIHTRFPKAIPNWGLPTANWALFFCHLQTKLARVATASWRDLRMRNLCGRSMWRSSMLMLFTVLAIGNKLYAYLALLSIVCVRLSVVVSISWTHFCSSFWVVIITVFQEAYKLFKLFDWAASTLSMNSFSFLFFNSQHVSSRKAFFFFWNFLGCPRMLCLYVCMYLCIYIHTCT